MVVKCQSNLEIDGRINRYSSVLRIWRSSTSLMNGVIRLSGSNRKTGTMRRYSTKRSLTTRNWLRGLLMLIILLLYHSREAYLVNPFTLISCFRLFD
jgi:hypothetical protein